MSFWGWIFGKGKDAKRPGPAHSSDRHGFWKDLWHLRKIFDEDPEHSGSVDIYDHFGCAPYNDNSTKRERRDMARPVLEVLMRTSWNHKLKRECRELLSAFEAADKERKWHA